MWQSWREHRRWRTELKDVPLHQLRATHFNDPKKRRWVQSWVWRREHLWGNPIALGSLIVGTIGVLVAIVGLIAHWRGWF